MIIILLGDIWDLKFKLGDNVLHFCLILALNGLEDIPNGLEDEIDTKRPVILVFGFLWKLFFLGVVIVVSPHVFADFLRVFAQFLGQKISEDFNWESPIIQCWAEDDILLLSRKVELAFQLFDVFFSEVLRLGTTSFFVAALFENKSSEDSVDLLYDLGDVGVRLHWVHFAVSDEFIDFV